MSRCSICRCREPRAGLRTCQYCADRARRYQQARRARVTKVRGQRRCRTGGWAPRRVESVEVRTSRYPQPPSDLREVPGLALAVDCGGRRAARYVDGAWREVDMAASSLLARASAALVRRAWSDA